MVKIKGTSNRLRLWCVTLLFSTVLSAHVVAIIHRGPVWSDLIALAYVPYFAYAFTDIRKQKRAQPYQLASFVLVTVAFLRIGL